MEHERLERLILDSSLGGLSDDAECLLREYLEKTGDPAKAEAAELREVVALARKAMVGARCPLLPEFPGARLRRSEARWRAWVGACRVASLAGFAFVGLVIGVLCVGHVRAPGPTDEARPLGPEQVVRAVGDRSLEGAEPRGLWSQERLVGEVPRATPPAGWKLAWTSVMGNPRVEAIRE